MTNFNFETLAIRTQMERTAQKEHSTPLFLTSGFVFDSAEEGAALFLGQKEGNLYSRFSNPNTDEFIKKLCLLEECDTGVATASGMAAVYTTFAANLQNGDHILASRDIFGNASYIITQILPKMGIDYTLVDVDNLEEWEAGVRKNTKLIYVETPTNPTLKTADLAFLGRLSKEHKILYVVDNCFATPYLQQPAKFGADIVIHSATKFIDGQGRVLGGAILGKSEPVSNCYGFIRRTGACLSPFNAWILSKSLETLAVRMDRHCDNALDLVKYLSEHPNISKVTYPHFSTYPQFDLAKKQMRKGGGLVGCELKGGLERSKKFLNALKMHSLTSNLGDCRSIATHPATTTHSKLNSEEQLRMGISPGFIRFSVGLENIQDIIEDIDQALR